MGGSCVTYGKECLQGADWKTQFKVTA